MHNFRATYKNNNTTFDKWPQNGKKKILPFSLRQLNLCFVDTQMHILVELVNYKLQLKCIHVDLVVFSTKTKPIPKRVASSLSHFACAKWIF